MKRAVLLLPVALCFAQLAGAQPGTLPSTAETAGAFADTPRAPGPDVAVVSASCNGDVQYCPSAAQLRTDKSFSPFPLDSLLRAAKGQLAPMADDCDPSDGCDWRDTNGVRHFLWGDDDGDGQDELRVVIKTIEASAFAGRPIPALGIGHARKKAEVLANVRHFLGDLEIDCDPAHVSGNVGPVECGATLNPGWIQVGFDEDGNLLRVRFDGYQFI